MKNRLINIFCMVSLFLYMASVSSHAQGSMSLTLQQAFNMALERHVDVVVAGERVNQAMARIGQSRSVFLPQLSAGASGKRETMDLRSIGTQAPDPLVGPFNSFDARLRLQQTLFDPAAMGRLRAVHANRDLSEAELKKVQQDALALVAMLFIDAKRAKESRKAAQAVFRYNDEKLKLSQAKFKNGTGSSVEVKQALAKRMESLHLWRASISESIELRLDLASALGIPADQMIHFADEDAVDVPMPDKADIKRAVEIHPDVGVAQYGIEQRKAELASQRSGYLPKVSAVADYGRSGEDPSNSSNTYTVGLQASVPILEGGFRQAAVNEAQSRVKESEALLEDATLHAQSRVVIAIQSLQEMKLFVEQRNAELDASQQRFVLAQNRFHSGSGSRLELLQASADKMIAEDNKEEARSMYLLAQINLAHALGKVDQFFKEEGRE